MQGIELSRRAALIGAGAAALPGGARAQRAQDTLRIVMRDALPNIDPYFNNLRTGLVMAHQGWDTLIHRDPANFELVPLLATAWRWIEPTVLELDLRQGVKFHDGSDFTADDVVYTIGIAANPDSRVSTPSNYAWMDRAEKIDTHKVRLHLKRPNPAALEYLALVTPIYPKAYRERVGPEAYTRAPVGAGPYRITRFDPGAAVEFERFDGYWAGSPKGRPAIRRLSVRFVPDAATELTELLAQRADWIWNVNPDQFANIDRLPTLRGVRKESMRVGYLSLDAAGRTGAENPLTKVKVRQAIFHAIDRKAIADRLVTGGSRVPDAPCYPSQFGCDAEAATAYAYDPARAKALLAEAGYPDGFETELVTYILPTWAAALQNYLQAVGIRARLTHMQVSAAIARNWANQTPLFAGSWGSYSINDVSAIMPVFFGGGNDDYTRDAEMIALMTAGGSSLDPAERRTAYTAAIKRATENAFFLPLHTYVTTYAHARALDFTPFPDELPRFYLAKWA